MEARCNVCYQWFDLGDGEAVLKHCHDRVSRPPVPSAKDLAEAHWEYTEKVLRAAGLPDNTIAFGRVLYLESWLHADKHAREAAKEK